MKQKMVSRRELLKNVCFAAAVVLPGELLISSCKSKGEEKNSADVVKEPSDCNDLSGVSDQDVELRKKFAYVNESPIPDNQCNSCNLYLPPANGKKCGGCMLFKGPVHPAGYCTYWAPKV
jgi:hypothetical protein